MSAIRRPFSFWPVSRLLLIITALSFVSGCSTIYRTTGWFAYDFTEDYAIPYSLKGNDPQMACGLATAMTPALMSFTELTYTPDRAAVSMYMMAGSCAEEKAHEEALSYLRAFKAQNVSEAKDARIREKRQFAVAAQRQYQAYRHMVAEFGEPGESCPELDRDQEIFWVLGSLAGMQAVMSDLRSQNSVNVPKDIAMKTVRGIQCVDNQRWWGLPQALQAGLWVMMPDTAPQGMDPWQQLADASRLANASGVRMAHAIEVVIADGSGNTAQLKDAIRRHADSLQSVSPKAEYRMMDIMASRQILAVSDRLWTEATGSRTPLGGLGTFWDDAPAATGGLDIDDLLGE
ncbi:MAG: hypothetical protein CMI08_01045 [Oceanospirillaceae bacterium]|uniref:hypothetical protein n=1 Tax=Thalassolituus sp. UBA6592 TaxID=1947665 RepID=UPI000C0B1E56|nr:hypothetical protein [Thalassolituus sp. UBA6592]MAK92170.1 hypothetical protein [Thalassolituus sp.]MAS24832.1 hypothetical protein [Oceanospirillaceae bacterium]MAX97783.1 hypothetical protein [Oceanospirillaceae bacterium]MBL34748.1 hypothetical protein [Oceanospirillaceae bacterium]MBS52822.1 hypothetical protein [Oceanospirillaceae bacterium]|tara:strand:+ start:249 stop:1286 length:1038 start_codon:yes stop_codon:yes gene_type:complete